MGGRHLYIQTRYNINYPELNPPNINRTHIISGKRSSYEAFSKGKKPHEANIMGRLNKPPISTYIHGETNRKKKKQPHLSLRIPMFSPVADDRRVLLL